MTAKFRRSDGLELEAEIGSASFEMMEKQGDFQRIDDEPAKAESDVEIDLSKLNKKQLLEEAAKRGVEADEQMTKAAIIAAVEAKAASIVEEDAEGDFEDDGSTEEAEDEK